MAGFSVTLTCRKCARTITVTDVTDLAAGNAKEEATKCPNCKEPFRWWVSVVWVKHSADAGAFSKITNTSATPGAVSTAVSEHIA